MEDMSTEDPKKSEGDSHPTAVHPDQQLVAVRQKMNTAAAVVISPPHNAHGGSAIPINPLHSVHLALRGKYLWSIVLGLICGGAIGAIAWRLAKPIYHAEGLLRIAYSLPEVVQETDQNKPLAQFDTYLQSQKMLIGSQKILGEAIQSPIWHQSKLQVPPYPEQFFAKNMKIDIRPRSEYIQVSVTDTDPNIAATAVTTVINAYFAYYTSRENDAKSTRDRALLERQTKASELIKNLQAQAATESKEYSTTKLDGIYDAAAAGIAKWDTALDDVRIRMVTAPAAVGIPAPVASAPPSTQPVLLTAKQIAMTDPLMQSLLQEQHRLEVDLRHLKIKFLESNKSLIPVKQDLEEVQARIDAQVALHREYQAVAKEGFSDYRNGAVGSTRQSLEELKAMEVRLMELRNKAKEDLGRIGAARQKLEPILAKLATARAELERVNTRIGALETESLSGSRLSMVSTAEPPVSPDKDLRPWLAGAGGLGGACVPALFMLLRYRVARRVYQYSDETETDVQARIPLLGTLPNLENVSADSDEAAAAAHSIHQIRVTLRSQSARDGARVYLVTSAAAGEGKTSATMALALSFAASRERILVIDGDLVGRRFTENLKATELEGFHEALAAGSMNRLVRTMADGVSVLPTGRASMRDACGIPTQKIRLLLEQARQNFDVVLIDSGPILGSVEAAVLAQEVDSVIFMVGRGQQRGLVETSLQRLRMLGVPTAGIIFNRAHSSDFIRSAYSSGRQSIRSPDAPIISPSPPGLLERFGPLVQAVIAGVPASRN